MAGDGEGPRIFKMVGTVKGLADTVAGTLMKDISIMSWMVRDDARKSMGEFLQANAPGEWQAAPMEYNGHAMYPAEAPEGWATLTWSDGGEIKGIWVKKEYAEGFDYSDESPDKIVAALTRYTVDPARFLLTQGNPAFWVRNQYRDFMSAVIRLPGATAVWSPRRDTHSFMASMVEALGPTYDYVFKGEMPVGGPIEEMLKNRELVSRPNRMASETRGTELERLVKRFNIDIGKPNSAWDRLSAILEVWQSPGEFGETLTKTAAHIYLKKHYPNLDERTRGHIVRQAGSPPFGRRDISWSLHKA
jgi:hypothetical protein